MSLILDKAESLTQVQLKTLTEKVFGFQGFRIPQLEVRHYIRVL